MRQNLSNSLERCAASTLRG